MLTVIPHLSPNKCLSPITKNVRILIDTEGLLAMPNCRNILLIQDVTTAHELLSTKHYHGHILLILQHFLCGCYALLEFFGIGVPLCVIQELVNLLNLFVEWEAVFVFWVEFEAHSDLFQGVSSVSDVV